MALFKVLDFIRWSGDLGILAHRDKENNFGKFTKLQVNEAQEAVIVLNGVKSQKFGPGTYTLNSPNVPILKEFYGIPYGGDNPWTAQVWFINKVHGMNFDWYVDSFQFSDPEFSSIPITARGVYGATVVDAEKFILNLCLGFPVGSNGVNVRADDFTDQIRGRLNNKAKSFISKIMNSNGIGINSISSHLSDVSDYLRDQLAPFFDEFGCKLLDFNVEAIEIDVDTERGRKVQQMIDMQTEQKITGHTWQQQKMFDTVDKAFTSMNNNGSGLLGTIMAANMMGAFGGSGVSGQMMAPASQQTYTGGNPQPGSPAMNQQQYQQQGANQAPQVMEVYCSNCNKHYPSTNKFCPYCGDPYNPCPRCGSDNAPDATRCVNCGIQLSNVQDLCPNCNTPIPQGSAFCPNCGRPQQADNVCPRCGTNVKGATFCPNCGNKVK